jgi:hypothetical protein
VTFIEKDIRDHLAASTNIYDAFSDRIYPDVIPQDKRDFECAIVINDLSKTPEYSLIGEVGTHTTVVQINVWTDGSGGKARANELAELVRNRLNGYRGTFGTGSYGTARFIGGGGSTAAPPADGSDMHRRRVSMDFEVIHTASVPTLT